MEVGRGVRMRVAVRIERAGKAYALGMEVGRGASMRVIVSRR